MRTWWPNHGRYWGLSNGQKPLCFDLERGCRKSGGLRCNACVDSWNMGHDLSTRLGRVVLILCRTRLLWVSLALFVWRTSRLGILEDSDGFYSDWGVFPI